MRSKTHKAFFYKTKCRHDAYGNMNKSIYLLDCRYQQSSHVFCKKSLPSVVADTFAMDGSDKSAPCGPDRLRGCIDLLSSNSESTIATVMSTAYAEEK